MRGSLRILKMYGGGGRSHLVFTLTFSAKAFWLGEAHPHNTLFLP